METNEDAVRKLVEGWVDAVGRGDLDGVTRAHGDDVVMFDVPPPEAGVRGMAAYAQTWPGFFAWQAAGAVFELDELDVHAGEDVAFAWALLRCGMPDDLDVDPTRRLRLTLGLERRDGAWLVVHEHHSFTDHTVEAGAAVTAVHGTWADATARGDLDAMMTAVAEDVVSYEEDGDPELVGRDVVRAYCARGLETPGDVALENVDLRVEAGGYLAVSWGRERVRVDDPSGTTVIHEARATRVFRRLGDQ